jgi:hypothetical protein
MIKRCKITYKHDILSFVVLMIMTTMPMQKNLYDQHYEPELYSAGVRDFLFSIMPRQVLRHIKPPIPWIQGALCPRVNWSEHEAYHSPPASVEVKNVVVIYPRSLKHN